MRVVFASMGTGEVASFGIMYVSAALRRAGHEVELIESESVDIVLRAIGRDPPDVLAFSVTTGLHRIYLAWARAVKRAFPWVITLMGGPHPTFFPEIVEDPSIDAIVIGEGEATAPLLLDALGARDGRVVDGARYKLDGAIVQGGLRAPEQHLDTLPWPDRELFFNRSRFHARFPVKPFLASRGCPYRCTYCFNRTLNDMYRGRSRAVRTRSPASVVAEIREVARRWPMKLVWFLDANFVVSRRWVEELCERLARDVGLPFYCKVRPNLVDESLARTLALGGCTGVGMGVECGDDRLRNAVLERNISRETILNACRCLHDVGIAVMSFNMVGLPGETYEMARSTVDLNIEARVEYAMATVFQPYPRTVLAQRAIETGDFHGDFERIDTNYYSTCQMRESVPGDRARIENLQRLFGIAVAFPEIRRHLDRLVAINAPRFYRELFKRHHRHSFYRHFYERYRNPEVGRLHGGLPAGGFSRSMTSGKDDRPWP